MYFQRWIAVGALGKRIRQLWINLATLSTCKHIPPPSGFFTARFSNVNRRRRRARQTTGWSWLCVWRATQVSGEKNPTFIPEHKLMTYVIHTQNRLCGFLLWPLLPHLFSLCSHCSVCWATACGLSVAGVNFVVSLKPGGECLSCLLCCNNFTALLLLFHTDTLSHTRNHFGLSPKYYKGTIFSCMKRMLCASV